MIVYDKKRDRAVNTLTGRFVKFSTARKSAIFRTQYEPIMLKHKVKELKEELIEKEKFIEQLKERKVPSKQWVKIIPPAKDLSPIMMYAEMKSSLSRYKYQKAMKEISKQTTSNKKLRVLRNLYNEWRGIE